MALPIGAAPLAVSAAAGAVVLVAQSAIGDDATVVGILGAALTASVTLIGWMVRQLMSGNWVRKEQADIVAQLNKSTKALEASNELSQRLIDKAFGE